jgi:hypothetical protein
MYQDRSATKLESLQIGFPVIEKGLAAKKGANSASR